MQQFAKKSTALAFIYLVLSIPAINAARIKQATRARAGAVATQGLESLIQENGELKGQLEAMKEMAEFTSELSKLKAEMKTGKTGYWGESWATCEQRLEDLERREHKLEQRFEAGMEDGQLDTLEAGRVGLKGCSVASTLSTAAKNGCEWATTRQVNTSAMDRVMKEVMSKQECLPQAKAYIEKCEANKVDPEEAKAGAIKIMLAPDCKLPADGEMSEELEKTVSELAQLEDDAETGALDMAQQFADSMQGANGTALLQSRSSAQIFPILYIFMQYLLFLLMYTLLCTLYFTIVVTILTMVFLTLKALFKFALGMTGTSDFKAEMGSIIKPFMTVSATGCSVFTTAMITPLYSLAFASVGYEASATIMAYLGLTLSVGEVAVGADTLGDQLFGEDEATEPKDE